MEVMAMYGVYVGICALIVGAVFMSKYSKPSAFKSVKDEAPSLSKAEMRAKFQAQIKERRYLKYLNRRIRWARNRLINYPTLCKATTRDRAEKVVKKAIKVEGKYGIRKEIRETAIRLQEEYDNKKNETLPPVRIANQARASFHVPRFNIRKSVGVNEELPAAA